MTSQSSPNIEQLKSRLADLQAAQERATSWGAAVGARHEEILGIQRQLRALEAPQSSPETARLAELIGYHLASVCSGNNMPHMSGDPRNRIPPGRRRHFDDACLSAAEAVVSSFGLAQSSQDRDDLRSNALILLAAEDERQSRLHALLETIREQIRLEVAPEHRPATLFQNIQDAVYAMRGRTLLMNDAAITAALSDTSTSRAREAVARWVEEPEVKDELHRRPSDSSPEHGSK